jgi:hypothetical protein
MARQNPLFSGQNGSGAHLLADIGVNGRDFAVRDV